MTLSKKVLLIALILSIVLTLFFIFSNSLKSPGQSMEESNNATDKIEEVVPPDTTFGAFLSTYLRKIAHFLEFALLGYEIFLVVRIYLGGGAIWIISSVLLGVLTALLDETLQIASRRGSSVVDVWIDISGYAFATLASVIVVTIVKRRKNISAKRRKAELGDTM